MSDLDLPLQQTPASRFLVWISMALVFLAVLAFALAAMSDTAVRDFNRKPKIMTVALSPATSPEEEAVSTARVLAYLKGINGVAFASPVSEQELGMIVEPWLGRDDVTKTLPLPRLIDVAFNPGIEPDLGQIDDKLKKLAPGASIGYGGLESDQSAELAKVVRTMSLSSGAALIVIIVIVSVVVTRMSLDLHEQTVELLRLMGAGDAYVARQFEQHALLSALKGALFGFVAAIMLLLVLVWLGEAWFKNVIVIELKPLDWVLLAMTPVVAAVLMAAAARRTARWSLSRLH